MGAFPVKSGQLFLLIGDSITDCGRRGDSAPYGDGYVSLFRDLVIARHPERDIRWLNRGIGGNRVTNLYDRWDDGSGHTRVHAITAASDGSAMWIAMPVGISSVWPGAISSGSCSMARRSMPAEPGVA